MRYSFKINPLPHCGHSTSGQHWRRMIYYFLMVVVSPVILFAFVLLFGSDSYQWWGDRFHYELTNRYLFTRAATDTILGPLWREDTLGGHVWATSVAPASLALHILAGRAFQLSPAGIEAVANLTLYFVAVWSMYLYLRRVFGLHVESATVSAVMFAATAYWVSIVIGNPEIPMAIACLPALLILSHRIDLAIRGMNWTDVGLATAGLALALGVFEMHSSVVSLPITFLLVVAYAGIVFGLNRSFLWIVLALSVGSVLYLPFVWPIIEATRYSGRFDGTVFFSGQQTPIGPSQWLHEGKLILSRISVGHNQYGVYAVSILGALISLCVGLKWSREPEQVRRVLWFAMVSSVLIPVAEVFHLTVDSLKKGIPLIGGWSSSRFQYAEFFPIVTLAAWMLDRALFRSFDELPSSGRRRAIRTAVLVTGIIGSIQIVYSTYRMTQVPSSIYPQNLVLFCGLLMYAISLYVVLILVYRGVAKQSTPFTLMTGDERFVSTLFLVVAVSLTISVHAYRQGVIGMRTSDMTIENGVVMSYAERYRVPSDLVATKSINLSDGRVVDLTRPYFATKVGPGGEAPLTSLGGFRVPFGYSAAIPSWYERFIYRAINGMSSGPRTVVQVMDTGRTNFDALGLLDVEYILAVAGTQVPGYEPVSEFQENGKTLFRFTADDVVGPAFVSPEVACFSDDEHALDYIHEARMRELRGQAVLVSSDPSVASLCTGKIAKQSFSVPSPQEIRVRRAPDRVIVNIDNSPGGILTLTDTYYPGWKVFVNEMERPILRTYTTLRGVIVEPGRHMVVFVYEPKIFWVLLRISAVLLGCLVLLIIVMWWQSRAILKRRQEAHQVADL